VFDQLIRRATSTSFSKQDCLARETSASSINRCGTSLNLVGHCSLALFHRKLSVRDDSLSASSIGITSLVPVEGTLRPHQKKTKESVSHLLTNGLTQLCCLPGRRGSTWFGFPEYVHWLRRRFHDDAANNGLFLPCHRWLVVGLRLWSCLRGSGRLEDLSLENLALVGVSL
jgi:hypothetical protein